MYELALQYSVLSMCGSVHGSLLSTLLGTLLLLIHTLLALTLLCMLSTPLHTHTAVFDFGQYIGDSTKLGQWCIDVGGGSLTDGNKLQLSQCTSSQKWQGGG
jgi:hypothetical protein